MRKNVLSYQLSKYSSFINIGWGIDTSIKQESKTCSWIYEDLICDKSSNIYKWGKNELV